MQREAGKGPGAVVTLDHARALAKTRVEELFSGAVLIEQPILGGPYGWVFEYQSAATLRTGEIGEALVGNAPILIDKHTGQAIVLGSGLPAEIYVENYVACGDAFAFPGSRVLLIGPASDAGADRLRAMRLLRKSLDLGWGEERGLVDTCLSGTQTEIDCPSVDVAERLAHALREAGVHAEQIRE